jgi:hypothetical protein
MLQGNPCSFLGLVYESAVYSRTVAQPPGGRVPHFLGSLVPHYRLAMGWPPNFKNVVVPLLAYS